MHSPVEKMRKELEIERVRLSRKEMEFKIIERLADIDRLKAEIANQLKREEELKEQLKEN